jgi:hypothetical protein
MRRISRTQLSRVAAIFWCISAGSLPVEASFDALFPEQPQTQSREAVGQDALARVADILEALAEAASLAPADRRATESVVLLQHLLGVYQLTPARYMAALAVANKAVQDNLARVRLLCRPFG